MILTQPQYSANTLHGSLIYSSVTSHLRAWDGDTWLVDFFNQGLGISQNYLRKPGQIKATHVCWLTFGGFQRPWAALFWFFFFILDPSSDILWLILILSYGSVIKPCFHRGSMVSWIRNPLISKTSPSATNFEFMESLLKLWTLKTKLLIMQRSHALPAHFAISWRLSTVLR